MVITPELFQHVLQLARLKVEKSLGITDDHDFYKPAGLDYASLSPEHKSALDDFEKAYTEWYQLHLELWKAGKSGALSAQESAKVDTLSARVDATRKAILDLTAE